MLRQRLIASLLLCNGRLVKGVRYAGQRDAGLPHTTARAHSAQGIDEIILLDISASRVGAEPDFAALERVAENCMTPLTFGGGINTAERAKRAMRCGADKVMLTTTAWARPDLVDELVGIYGAQAVVIGIDAVQIETGVAMYDHVASKAVASPSLFDWVREVLSRGAGELRVMRVDREGTREGLDLDLLARVKEIASVPVLIEGGAGNLDHVDAAFRAGADGVCLGTMLVFSDNNIVKIKRFLETRNRNVRAPS